MRLSIGFEGRAAPTGQPAQSHALGVVGEATEGSLDYLGTTSEQMSNPNGIAALSIAHAFFVSAEVTFSRRMCL